MHAPILFSPGYSQAYSSTVNSTVRHLRLRTTRRPSADGAERARAKQANVPLTASRQADKQEAIAEEKSELHASREVPAYLYVCSVLLAAPRSYQRPFPTAWSLRVPAAICNRMQIAMQQQIQTCRGSRFALGPAASGFLLSLDGHTENDLEWLHRAGLARSCDQGRNQEMEGAVKLS